MNEAQVLEAKNLRSTFGQFPSGVAIVTCADENALNGMTISSFSSVSISPALVSWAIRKESSKLKQFTETDNFAFSILRNDQIEAAKAFAKGDPQAFLAHDYSLGANGSPLIRCAIAYIECSRYAVYDGGDHIIILGQITRHERHEGRPLVFSQGQFGEPQEVNTSHKNAEISSSSSDKDGFLHLLPLLRSAESRLSNLLATHRKELQLTQISARILTLLSLGAKEVSFLDASINADPSAIRDQLNDLLNAQLVVENSDGFVITELGLERRLKLLTDAERIYEKELGKFSSAEIQSFKKILNQLSSD